MNKSERIRELLSSGMSAADIAKKVGCRVGLVYNVKSKANSAPAPKLGTGKTRQAAAAKRGRPVGGGDSKSGQIRALLSSGLSTAEIAKQVGCTIALVYNVKSKVNSGAQSKGKGRPKKSAGSSGVDSIVSILQQRESETQKLRAVLLRIKGVVEGVG